MLLSQALVRMLYLSDIGELDALLADVIRDRVPIVLTQILMRTLQSLEAQQLSEVTAYGVITLTGLASLPWASSLEPEIRKAIEAGKRLIGQSLKSCAQPEYIWVEKVTDS